MKKTVYTLALKGYSPELTAVTFKFMKRYAEKIEADFYVIEDRKFNLYPTYEKFQIYDLSKERGDEWSYFFDADTLIHPDFYDVTTLLTKDYTCAAYFHDFTPLRFRPDNMFLRDGRYIGKGSWCIICSDWTRDIWRPLEDITYEEAVANIFPTEDETVRIKKTKESLIDDYVVSRNISRFGLKHTTVSELSEAKKLNLGVQVMVNNKPEVSPYLQHDYGRTLEQKIVWTEQILRLWGIQT